jgi:ABC-type Zn2+ transport system substrate-binding protein/surface adhesin
VLSRVKQKRAALPQLNEVNFTYYIKQYVHLRKHEHEREQGHGHKHEHEHEHEHEKEHEYDNEQVH